MNYSQTIDFLFSQLPVFHRIGPAAYKANLDNTIALCKHLGNPEKEFKSVHIAGTNGKGSVANMLTSVLLESGYKTGLCTSPHLRDFRERIRVNGKMIPKSYVVKFVKDNKDFFLDLKPSFFEMFIALTFDYFANEGLDLAVIETGMGGRLDSTNVIKPELSVITNIGLDHTAFLGNTLEKIAAEKAGIIKNNIPVVIGRKQKETDQIFREKANNLKSELYYAADDYQIIDSSTVFKYNRFWLDMLISDGKIVRHYYSDQWGPYQAENIITTLKAVDVINESGRYSISEEAISDGLKRVRKNTGFEGRWQLNGKNPRILFDTGHNVDGLKLTMSYLYKINFNKLHFVLGMVDDKDVEGTLNLLPKDALYYYCEPDVPRGLKVEILENYAKKVALKGDAYGSVKAALTSAVKNASHNDLIFVGGSTFVVAEVI